MVKILVIKHEFNIIVEYQWSNFSWRNGERQKNFRSSQSFTTSRAISRQRKVYSWKSSYFSR